MNRKKLLFCGLIVLFLGTLFLLATRTSKRRSAGSSLNTIRFKAYIDGADTVKIQGNKIWYEHESWDLPGKSHGSNEPTIINGKKWFPAWKGINWNKGFTLFGSSVRLDVRPATHDNRSSAYSGLNPAFDPQSPAEIRLTKITGRGTVTISQMPGPKNNQTLALHFDDESFMGADWYEVAIDWK